MLTKYYGTGEYFAKDLPKIHRFKPNQSKIDVSARIFQRNNVLSFDNDPKQIIHKKHSKTEYKRNWRKANSIKKKGSTESFYEHGRNKKDIKPMTSGNFNRGRKENFNHKYPNNPQALKKVRRHIFSQGYKKPRDKSITGRIMDK